jgi:hypothetical protein
MPYIAVEALDGKQPHKEEFDYESFFYVIFLLGVSYPGPEQKVSIQSRKATIWPSAIQRWCSGSLKQAAAEKLFFMKNDNNVIAALYASLQNWTCDWSKELFIFIVTLYEELWTNGSFRVGASDNVFFSLGKEWLENNPVCSVFGRHWRF